MDQPKSPRLVASDNLGLSTAYAHAFRMRFGEDSVFSRERVAGMFAVSGDFEIIAMPGFLRPGRFDRVYTNGNFTSLQFRIASGEAGHATQVLFDSHYLGTYTQDFETRSRGYANELALASGLRFVDRRELAVRDQYGIVHLPHPAERVWFGLGPARLELEANVSPDFASIHSSAFDRYAEVFGIDGTKSSLMRHRYLHTWGISGEIQGAITIGAMEFGANARHGRYESIDGLERGQELVTRDSHGRETITDFAAHLQLEPPGTPLSTRFELAETRRTSSLNASLGDFRAESVVRRMSVELGIHF